MHLKGYNEVSVRDIDGLFADLESRLEGLTDDQVQERLLAYGPNMVSTGSVTAFDVLVRQLKSPFIYLLFGAIVVALIAGEIIDAIMIALFVGINVSLGFFQEYRAEQSSRILKKYWHESVRVMRGGSTAAIGAQDVAVGDVIKLQAGDKIPADVRFVTARNLTVDESILTGESIAVAKTADALASEPDEYHEAIDIGFSGTVVLSGEATAVVFATGGRSVLGSISKLVTETHAVSAFERDVAHFSRFILKLVGVTLALVFVFNIGMKGIGQIEELLLFSIALTIGVIPEALPLVMTVSLSNAALRMAKRGVIVKRLSAINDLGSVDVLCTDKTGTVTENRLKVTDVHAADKDGCLRLALLGSSFLGLKSRDSTNAFDLALWRRADRGLRGVATRSVKIAELPFDPVRRRNSVLLRAEDGSRLMVTRGSPDDVLPLCRRLPEPISIGRYLEQQGINGRRVIAVAIQSDFKGDSLTAADEAGLEFVGFIAFADPLKVGVKAAVAKAALLGVQVKIITGDAREVAGAVALQLRLIDEPHQVITGAEFDALPPAEQLQAVSRYHVFARMNPVQKFQVLSLLEQGGDTVGFLGEGFNDAPGLKIATVAMAVDNAADIARDASDVILLNKSLSVIIDGIEQGRRSFANITKYLKITLASNFGNFYAIAVASLFIPFLPMLPVQIILVNLLSDTPMISIAEDTVPLEELKKPSRYDARKLILSATIFGVISSGFDFLTFAIFRIFGEAQLQTLWFMESILTELVIIYSLRTSRFFLKGARVPKSIAFLTIGVAGLTILLPFTAFGQDVFRFFRPSVWHVALVLSIVAGYFIMTETAKLWMNGNKKA